MRLRRLVLALGLAALVRSPALRAQDLPIDKPDYGYVQTFSYDVERVTDFVWSSPPIEPYTVDHVRNMGDGDRITIGTRSMGSSPQLDWPPTGPNADALKGFTLDPYPKGGYVLKDPKGTWIAAYKCLPPGTLVRTPGGARAIESLDSGDLVLGRGGVAVRVERRTVTPDYDEGLVSLEVEGQVARLTPNHLVLVLRGGERAWVRADAVATGDALVGAPRGTLFELADLAFALEAAPTPVVSRVSREPYVGPVFNLVVPGHAYALEQGLVHDVTTER